MGLAAAAAVALTLTGLSTASAANVHLGPGDIDGFEIGGDGTDPNFNYDQWHIGNSTTLGTPVTDSLTFHECSIEYLAPLSGVMTQVLKGFPIPDRPSTVTDIRAAMLSASAVIGSGSVATLQFPFFDDTGAWQGTWRTQGPIVSGTPIDGSTLMENSGNVGVGVTLDNVLAGMVDGWQLLGIGVSASTGSQMNSMTFLGNTYYFGTSNCAPTPPTPPTKVDTAAE